MAGEVGPRVTPESFRDRLHAAVGGMSPRDRNALLRNLIQGCDLGTLYDLRDRLREDFGVHVSDGVVPFGVEVPQ